MKLALSIWTLAFAALLSPAAQAVDTLGRLKTQGEVRLGVRVDSGGLSYSWGDGNYGGFHVELCQRVIADLEKQMGRKIAIQWVPVTGQTRLFAMSNGTTDMECGATTCLVPCDHVPTRSWPYFQARSIMLGVIESLKQEEQT